MPAIASPPPRGTKFNDLVFDGVATREDAMAHGISLETSGPFWWVICEGPGPHGNENRTVKRSHYVKNGNTKSCGCRKTAVGIVKRLAVGEKLRKPGESKGNLEFVRFATPDEVKDRPPRAAYGWYKCKLCERESIKKCSSVRAGHSLCKCETDRIALKTHHTDLSGTKSGFLAPQRLATPEERDRSSWKRITRTAFWACDCKCGEPNCKGVVVLPAKALVPGPRQVKSCGALRGKVARENAAHRENGKFKKRAATVNLPQIISLGNRAYKVSGNEPVIVTEIESDILDAFIRRPSMDSHQLAKESGYTPDQGRITIARLIKRYAGIFATAISRPGRKGGGGYHALVTRNPEKT